MDRPDDVSGVADAQASTLTSGPPFYVPKGPWGPIGALLAAIPLTLVSLAISVIIVFGVFAYVTGESLDDLTEREAESLSLVASAGMQVLTIIGIWWMAGWRGGNRREVLQLDGPKPSIAEIGLAIAGQIAVPSLAAGLFYLYDPARLMESYQSDVAPYLAAMRDPNARLLVPMILFLAIVLAPLSEEFLFRGFLLSALAKWRWGFWVPAILSTLLWTVLHGYSLMGALLVVVYGLYFSWLLWRTGQLWLSLICHAFANVLAMAAVAYFAFNVGVA